MRAFILALQTDMPPIPDDVLSVSLDRMSALVQYDERFTHPQFRYLVQLAKQLRHAETTGGVDRHGLENGHDSLDQTFQAGWDEGSSYKYDVYDWKKFPLKKMLITFGMRQKAGSSRVWIYQAVDYRLSPGFLTTIMKGKLRTSLRDTLLGYKHFMEMGEANADMKVLRKRYSNV